MPHCRRPRPAETCGHHAGAVAEIRHASPAKRVTDGVRIVVAGAAPGNWTVLCAAGCGGWRQARRDARQALPAGDGGEDLDLLAVGHRRVEPVAEADVLAVDVDVDEAAQAAVAIRQPVAQLAVALEQRVEHGADGGALDADGALTARGLAQLGRQLDLRHQTRTSAPSTSATNWS